MNLLLIISISDDVLGRNALYSIKHAYISKQHAKYGNYQQVALQEHTLAFKKGCSLTMATQKDSFSLVF